ncbi:MAG TPA: hypothetical protein ENN21_05355, partial [Spirochaetes bacterium]|nr:hypothetical protein [Spirochaetota bacterium]
MARDLEKNLSVLERKYLDFDTVYDEISRQIDILSSIYSSYNSLLGQEYLLKLKALMRNYRARYSLEGVNFNLIHFLQMKVRENLERSFEEYPRMEHLEEKRATRTPAPAKKTDRPAPSHQWHTFQRNGSWFIVPCAESLVYPFSDAPIEGDGDPKRFNLAMAMGGTVPIQDLFAPPAAGTARIHYVLVIKGPGGTSAFAADRAGRKIMAGRDFITPLLKGGSGFTPGKGSIRL